MKVRAYKAGGHVRWLRIEVDEALEISELTEISDGNRRPPSMKKTHAQLSANRVTSAGEFWWLGRPGMVFSPKPGALEPISGRRRLLCLVFVVHNRVSIYQASMD